MKPSNPHAAALRHLARRCEVMKGLIKRVGPCTLVAMPDDPFTLLVRCVISQQISTKAARSIFDRLAALVGGPPVKPEAIAALTDDQLAACGISGPKRRTIRALVEHFDANPHILPGIIDRDDDLIREQLVAIKGIGPWSVDMFLMFGLGRPDVLPVGDYGFRVGMMKAFGLRKQPKPDRLVKLTEHWRPYRSIATWYLWRSLGPVPQSE